ncbi:MAG: glucose 1-dehydrogenase [Pseudomonadota bacterium]
MDDPQHDGALPDPSTLFRIDGAVAVVTGAGSGIGRMAARVLARAGAIAIATDRDGDAASATADLIAVDGHSGAAYAMDVTEEASVVDVFARIETDYGRVGVLVNNAGIIDKAPTETLTLAQWQRVIDVNLTGVFLCAREAGRQMLADGQGSIINISSIWGHVGGPYSANLSYHTSKGAVVNLTRALAVEWGPRGVRVNDIAPTFLKTALTESLFADAALHSELARTTPLRRTGAPADLAGAILYLASPASALVTGLSLKVDGGWTAQ